MPTRLPKPILLFLIACCLVAASWVPPSPAGVAAGSAAAAERIRYSLPVGFEYRFESVVQLDLDLSIDSGGQTMQAEQVMTQVLRGAVRVTESDGGVPTQAEVKFTPDSGSVVRLMNQDQPAPFALGGRTVRATVDAQGVVTIEPADDAGPLPPLDDDTRRTVRGLVAPDPSFPPPNSVAEGDAWTATMGRDDEPIRPTLTFTVTRFDEVGGRRTAELATEGTVGGEDAGVQMRGELTGPVVVDLETGLQVSTRLSGPVETSSTLEQGGVKTEIAGSGTIRQANRLLIGEVFDEPFVQAPHPGAQPNGQPNGQPAAPGGREGWRVFRHPTGATFEHPADWMVQAQPNGLTIVPADHDPNREMIVGFGAPSQGILSATAPQAQAAMDAMITQQMPSLRRIGPPQEIPSDGGSAAMYRYQGQAPDGRRAECAVLVRVGGGYAQAFSILADEQRLADRLPTLMRMAATIQPPRGPGAPGQNAPGRQAPGEQAPGAGMPGTPGPGAQGAGLRTDDPRLIGMFAGEAITSGEGVYMNTRLVYALGADGVVHYGAQTHMHASDRDYNGNLIYTAHGASDGGVQRGRWSAANGYVTVRWDSGETTVVAYGFEPDGTLALRNAQTRQLINIYQRVQ